MGSLLTEKSQRGTDCAPHRLTDCLTGWLVDWLTDCQTERLAYLGEWLTENRLQFDSPRLAATQLHVIVDENIFSFIVIILFFCIFFFSNFFRHSVGVDLNNLWTGPERTWAAGADDGGLHLRGDSGPGPWSLPEFWVVTGFKVSQLMRKFRCNFCAGFSVSCVLFVCLHDCKWKKQNSCIIKLVIV